jgi:hypothetical protein
MTDRQKRKSVVVIGLFVGLLLGFLTGLPLYPSVKQYLDSARAQASYMFWDEAEMNEQLGLLRFLFSSAAVATVWVLAWGLVGAWIGRCTRTQAKRELAKEKEENKQ